MTSGRCIKNIWFNRCGRRRCTRAATRDEYCTQHHPDSFAKRRAKASALYDAKTASHFAPIDRAARIERAAKRVVSVAYSEIHGELLTAVEKLKEALKK